MKASLFTRLAIVASAIVCLAACKDKQPSFTIEGSVSNADSAMLYFQKRSLTAIETLDSIKLDSDGKFKFEKPSLGYSEYYLLKLGEQIINLAVDSTETIIINAPKDAFATDYSIEGSESTKKIKEVTLAQYRLTNTIKELNKKYEARVLLPDDYYAKVQETITEYKNIARDVILTDNTSMAGYFALFQKVDNLLIFDPYNKKDLAMFQSIATTWDLNKPTSPRTAHVREFTLSALAQYRQQNANSTAVDSLAIKETEASEYYRITLPGIDGKEISSSSFNGKVVVLDITAYQTEYSPAHNIYLNNIYSKHKGAIEIYQVSLDSDTHLWRNAASNLPWICVHDSRSLASPYVTQFNVQGLPTTFLMDKNGNLAKRIFPSDDLEKEIRKLL